MGKLESKVAIVTGAVRGLGRAYAKRIAGLECPTIKSDTALSQIGFSARPLLISTTDTDQTCRLLGDETDPRKRKCH